VALAVNIFAPVGICSLLISSSRAFKSRMYIGIRCMSPFIL
jgi:hypothetical protein